MSSWTAASSDCSRPVNNYVHVKTADLYRPNARLTPERQGYQVLTPFGKLGYSPIFDRYNIIHEQELLDAGDQLVAYLAQQAQAPRRRAHPAGTAAPRPASPLRLVRRGTA